MNDTKVKIGFLTISDRAFNGVYEDIGGPAMEKWVRNAILSPYDSYSSIISDERGGIEDKLIEMADKEGCNLILTTGGTGPTQRDVTPEATEAACQRVFPGFGEQMRKVSLETVPTAILSRQLAGTRNETLMVNLPGKPDAIDVCLKSIFLAVPKCLELIANKNIQIDLDFIESNGYNY